MFYILDFYNLSISSAKPLVNILQPEAGNVCQLDVGNPNINSVDTNAGIGIWSILYFLPLRQYVVHWIVLNKLLLF